MNSTVSAFKIGGPGNLTPRGQPVPGRGSKTGTVRFQPLGGISDVSEEHVQIETTELDQQIEIKQKQQGKFDFKNLQIANKTRC